MIESELNLQFLSVSSRSFSFLLLLPLHGQRERNKRPNFSHNVSCAYLTGSSGVRRRKIPFVYYFDE